MWNTVLSDQVYITKNSMTYCTFHSVHFPHEKSYRLSFIVYFYTGTRASYFEKEMEYIFFNALIQSEIIQVGMLHFCPILKPTTYTAKLVRLVFNLSLEFGKAIAILVFRRYFA